MKCTGLSEGAGAGAGAVCGVQCAVCSVQFPACHRQIFSTSNQIGLIKILFIIVGFQERIAYIGLTKIYHSYTF